MNGNHYAYKEASAGGATTIDLLTLVYDALAADLLHAGQASQDRNIQARCSSSNHALLLLGHLESWAGALDSPTLAQSLGQFYCFLRGRILHLQGNGTLEDFSNLAGLVLAVRSTWQVKSRQTLEAHIAPTAPLSLSMQEEESTPARAVWCA